MTDISTIVVFLAALVSATYRTFTGNLLAFFNMLEPLLSLRNVAWTAVPGELAKLSPSQRQTLDAQFAAALSIPDPRFLAQVVQGESIVEGLVDLAVNGYAEYTGVMAIVARVTALLHPTAVASMRKLGAIPPALLAGLPVWVQWMIPVLVSVLSTYVAPLLIKAFPAEAGLIQQIIAFLSGPMPSYAVAAHYKNPKTLKSYLLGR